MAALKALMRRVGITGTNLEDFDIECGRICANSLKCGKGDTFIAIKGVHADGHDFICTAVQHGAALVVCERVTEYLADHPEIPYITVKNTRSAWAHMWNEYCGRPGDRLITVAVTGTNGKTSVTYFLREIFKRAGYVTGIIGTVKCFIGDRCEVLSDSADSSVNSMTTPPPDALYPMLEKMAAEGVEIVFMEASSHALVQHRLDPLRFTVGVFTGLTGDHLDYHGSMEEYYLAKRRLFSLCGAAVICGDSMYAERLSSEIPIPSVFYTVNSTVGQYRAVDSVYSDPSGIRYTFCDKTERYDIVCPVAGQFAVPNTLAAASVARLFGIQPEVIAAALASCPQIPGRMERVGLPEDADFRVFIDYAHTPDALEKVIKTLLCFVEPGGRLVVLFGCGGDRDRSKRPIMGRIATSFADLTVITSDNSRSENPRSIICDIIRGTADGADCKVIVKREAAIRYVIENHRPGDVILLAGKGHEDYEIDHLGKHPLIEADVVREAAGRIITRQDP